MPVALLKQCQSTKVDANVVTTPAPTGVRNEQQSNSKTRRKVRRSQSQADSVSSPVGSCDNTCDSQSLLPPVPGSRARPVRHGGQHVQLVQLQQHCEGNFVHGAEIYIHH